MHQGLHACTLLIKQWKGRCQKNLQNKLTDMYIPLDQYSSQLTLPSFGQIEALREERDSLLAFSNRLASSLRDEKAKAQLQASK